MNNEVELVKTVIDSTECLNGNLKYLTETEKLTVHDLSAILVNLDNVWEIIKDKF